MSQGEYTVRLEAFEGPLDLLLFLIRRAEVEITDIPIAAITSQYMEFVNRLLTAHGPGGVDIEDAGEFLVMAATLTEIKSRMLTPVNSKAGEGGEGEGAVDSGSKANAPIDPRESLVRQLIEYKKFRDAASRLDELKREWEGRHGGARAGQLEAPEPEVSEAEGAEAAIEIGDLTLIDIVEAFGRIVETVDFSRVGADGSHRVVMDDTPVEVHAEDLLNRLQARLAEPLLPTHEHTIGLSAGEMDFREVFVGRTRSEAIGLFLAVLELVKQQRVVLRQEATEHAAGRIVLGLRKGDEAGVGVGASSANAETSRAS